MLHLTLYAAANVRIDLDDFFEALNAVAYSRPGPTRLHAGGSISLDPDAPYPKDHDVTATFLGTGFEYDKHSFPLTVGDHTSNFVTWTFARGTLSGVTLQLDGRPLLAERFDAPYFTQVLPREIGSIAQGVSFTGNNFGNVFDGSNVRDVLRGLGGNDVLWGAGGNDTLTGGNGADRLNGGGGADLMAGGAGSDSYRVDSSGDRVVEAAGQGRDRVVASVSHVLEANVEELALVGAAANAVGNRGANLLTGTAGANLIDGRGGADTLAGGMGADWLVGGAGADSFAFASALHSLPGAMDVIADFEEGVDSIDLAGLGAGLRFIGGARFGGTAGEVRYGGHVVGVDLDGDAVADFAVRIRGEVALSADDFQL